MPEQWSKRGRRRREYLFGLHVCSCWLCMPGKKKLRMRARTTTERAALRREEALDD